MRDIILYSLVALSIISCKPNKIKDTSQSNLTRKIENLKEEQPFPVLIEGEVQLKDDAFGDIIELKGESHEVDQIFKVSETEMIAKDSLLIVKNRSGENLFMVFSLPGFKVIKSFGKIGKRPGEFQFPTLVKAAENNALCYIYEMAPEKLNSLGRNYEIKELPISLPGAKNQFGNKQLYSLSDSTFMYVESMKGGKGIFSLQPHKDSASSNLIYNLAFSKGHKNWAAYIGDFDVCKQNQRMVVAYKYFKRLVFMDLEGKKIRTLIFNQQDAKKGDLISMLGPDNVTHYWGMSAQKDYVYVLYSGRTPIVVSKELNKTSGYIYVEQFDWNGNLIRKFKLDHWGYFCVNEAENTIYLATTTDDQPFYTYKLSEK